MPVAGMQHAHPQSAAYAMSLCQMRCQCSWDLLHLVAASAMAGFWIATCGVHHHRCDVLRQLFQHPGHISNRFKTACFKAVSCDDCQPSTIRVCTVCVCVCRRERLS